MADEKKPPVKRPGSGDPVAASSSGDIDAFLAQARNLAPPVEGRGRLIFALDATMSRQPTWDTACRLQAEMFDAAGDVGGLDVQLVYFRGFGECRASKWVSDTRTLRDMMTGIDCRGGHTQIGKVLIHARTRDRQAQGRRAGLRRRRARGADRRRLRPRPANSASSASACSSSRKDEIRMVERGFREIARLSGGAYARFDINAAGELAALLRAAAIYAAGGLKALAKKGGAGARLLLAQMRSGDGLSRRRSRRPGDRLCLCAGLCRRQPANPCPRHSLYGRDRSDHCRSVSGPCRTVGDRIAADRRRHLGALDRPHRPDRPRRSDADSRILVRRSGRRFSKCASITTPAR